MSEPAQPTAWSSQPVAPATAAARGTVRIAPAVLIELIELTVRDLPGIAGFQPRRRMDRFRPLPRGVPGGTTEAGEERSFEAGGVRVCLRGDALEAEISVIVQPDTNIMALSRQIQRQVGAAVERMLGMRVTEVNVFVADIERAETVAPERDR